MTTYRRVLVTVKVWFEDVASTEREKSVVQYWRDDMTAEQVLDQAMRFLGVNEEEIRTSAKPPEE